MPRANPTAADALALLERGHKMLEALLARTESDPRACADLRHALEVHGRLQHELLFPALEQARRGKPAPRFDQARREHAWLRVRLIELTATDPQDRPLFRSRLQPLGERLWRRIARERASLFRRARRALTPRQLRELGARMLSREYELNGGLYPG
jgi:hypothetical protein